MNDRLARQAIDFALAEIEIGTQSLRLAKLDRSHFASHLTDARYACAEARRHLTRATSSDPASAPVEAQIDKLLAEVDEWERENGLNGAVGA